MATPIKDGAELSIISIQQFADPVITGLATGRFLVAWEDTTPAADGSNSGIRAHLYHADGTADGVPFLVNTTTTRYQQKPTATALADGGFVVAWDDGSRYTGGDISSHDIRAQVFGPTATPLGGEFLVNTITPGPQDTPTATRLTNGNFVVAWHDLSQNRGSPAHLGDPDHAIGAQVFTAGGVPVGMEFLVNTTTRGTQDAPTVAALAGGGFVAAWHDVSQSGGDTSVGAIRAQVFSADGSKAGSELLVNTTTPNSQQEPTIAGLTNGGFVVAWRDSSVSGGDTSVTAIRAQVFGPTGAPVGIERLVNTTTALAQDQPTITALGEGGFVVAWTDGSRTGGDTSGSAIRAQAFTADGTPDGTEFLVNTTTNLAQYTPSISALADGRFAVAWKSDASTTLQAQIFDNRTAPIHLSGTSAGDEYVGTPFADWINGSAGDDRIEGRGGNDNLDGGVGNDSLIGGTGNDIYTVDTTADQVVENPGEGTDEVRSGLISLDLNNYANVENARLTGSRKLELTGDGNGNVLKGNSAPNQIIGGGGPDTLTGGFGDDIFRFETAAQSGINGNTDRITDFRGGTSASSGDRLDLRGIDADTTLPGNQAFRFIGSSKINHVGELAYDAASGILSGSATNAKIIDFQIILANHPTLHAFDILP